MSKSESSYILVVDDVAFMRRLLVGIIRTLGHDALEADSGLAAMKTIEKDPPDLIFLDLMMPRISRFKVCEWIRKNEATKKTPVIICIANQERKTMEQAIRAGATDILCKPVSRDNVKARISRHLQQTVPQS